MFMTSHFIVYPEGDEQEIQFPLRFGSLVGLNGVMLRPPLPTHKMIAYRVYKIRKDERRGEENTYYHLEQLGPDEMISLT
jgi:hypothetical protein